MPKLGPTKFCLLQAVHTSGCNSATCNSKSKKAASLLEAKRGRNRNRTTSLTANGQQILSAMNCTKLAGVSPSCYKKFCKPTPMR